MVSIVPKMPKIILHIWLVNKNSSESRITDDTVSEIRFADCEGPELYLVKDRCHYNLMSKAHCDLVAY